LEAMKKLCQLMNLPKEKSDFSLDIKFSKPEWKITKKEISADDENFIPTEEGFFYKGRRVILYINEQSQHFGNEYKFHLTACATLKSMLAKNLYERYVVSETETNLHVCKNCLHKLNWKNYKNVSAFNKNIIYQNFSIEEFFASVNNDNQKNFWR